MVIVMVDKQVRFDEHFISKNGVCVSMNIGFTVEYMGFHDEQVDGIESDCEVFLDRLKERYGRKEVDGDADGD